MFLSDFKRFPSSRMNDEAEKLKAEANECFKTNDYAGAIILYDKAIEVAPMAPVLYSNRSIAHLRSESPGLALKDASKGKENNTGYHTLKLQFSN